MARKWLTTEIRPGFTVARQLRIFTGFISSLKLGIPRARLKEQQLKRDGQDERFMLEWRRTTLELRQHVARKEDALLR